ncbi:MAG TPA: hypothetical protein VL357_06990 [Rariglobus sp.]|jgi:hypothetical protein|nr:hypothetical protein [Rariglobus sp.]
MKTLPLILAASLLANAAFVTNRVMHGSYQPGTTPTDTAGSAKSAMTAGANISGRDLVAALNTDDPAALRDILRAAGFSDDMVRTLVQMRIWKRYEARFKALQPKPDSDPNKPWWKDDARQSNWYGNMTKAQRDEMRQLQKDQRDEMARVLGPDKNGNNGGWQDPRLAFLPSEKRQQLQQIQQDYQELMGEVQQDMQGFQLPSDREKLRYLQEQQKADMDALMTPEERRNYDLRMSQTAQNLRWQMTKFDASEEEYLRIFPLQKAFDDKYNTNDSYGYVQRDQKFWQERQEAEKQLKEQIKGVIGDDRYTEYVRSQDGDYQQLQAATRRMDLPADTAARVYSLRDDVSAGARQIADNPNLSLDQKKQALADLAGSTRDQVRTALGAEAAEAYFKNNGMSWLQVLEKGNVITFSKDGQGWSTSSINSPPAKKK